MRITLSSQKNTFIHSQNASIAILADLLFYEVLCYTFIAEARALIWTIRVKIFV